MKPQALPLLAVLFGVVLTPAKAQQTIATFKDFPPRQKPASFTVDDAVEALSKPGEGK